MMSFDSADLLRVAGDLIGAPNPSDSHIARSISTSYYAIFQHFIFETSKLLIGPDQACLTRARAHLQRSISHTDLIKRCKKLEYQKLDFPQSIIDYANFIVILQDERHHADYARDKIFSKSDAERILSLSAAAITGFDRIDDRHKRAFIIWANFERRNY